MMDLQAKVYKKFREGYSMTQVAKAYGISFQTVKRYIKHVRQSSGGLLADDVEWTETETDLS